MMSSVNYSAGRIVCGEVRRNSQEINRLPPRLIFIEMRSLLTRWYIRIAHFSSMMSWRRGFRFLPKMTSNPLIFLCSSFLSAGERKKTTSLAPLPSHLSSFTWNEKVETDEISIGLTQHASVVHNHIPDTRSSIKCAFACHPLVANKSSRGDKFLSRCDVLSTTVAKGPWSHDLEAAFELNQVWPVW